MGKNKKRLTIQSIARRVREMPAEDVGYAGLTAFRAYSPQEARQVQRDKLIKNADGELHLLKELFQQYPQQRQAAYDDWARRGLLPPFDGLV